MRNQIVTQVPRHIDYPIEGMGCKPQKKTKSRVIFKRSKSNTLQMHCHLGIAFHEQEVRSMQKQLTKPASMRSATPNNQPCWLASCLFSDIGGDASLCSKRNAVRTNKNKTRSTTLTQESQLNYFPFLTRHRPYFSDILKEMQYAQIKRKHLLNIEEILLTMKWDKTQQSRNKTQKVYSCYSHFLRSLFIEASKK